MDSFAYSVVSLTRLHELLYICARFRGGRYSDKVMNLLKPGDMRFSQLFLMSSAVSLFKVEGAKPPFSPVTSKSTVMAGSPVVSAFQHDATEAWYFGEVKRRNITCVVVQYPDEGTEILWRYTQIKSDCHNRTGYVIPQDYWEAQVDELEKRKTRWTALINTNAMDTILSRRHKQLKEMKRHAQASDEAAGSATSGNAPTTTTELVSAVAEAAAVVAPPRAPARAVDGQMSGASDEQEMDEQEMDDDLAPRAANETLNSIDGFVEDDEHAQDDSAKATDPEPQARPTRTRRRNPRYA